MTTGEVTELGGRSREQIGPDEVGLFCGSEAHLGCGIGGGIPIRQTAQVLRDAWVGKLG